MAAACQEMEAMPERYLTLEEKAKLKERLALLKKEYKKTVHRLQRSQRAERVKTHIKKTIEEQNRLLSQELSGQDNASVLSVPYNVAGRVTESPQSVDPPSADRERKPSVSFNLDPEILQGENRSPSCSGSESSGQDPSAASKTEASGSSTPYQGKRSRLRLNRSARRVCTEAKPTSSLGGWGNPKEAGSTMSSTLCPNENGPLRIIGTTIRVSPECKIDLDVNSFVQRSINMDDTNAPSSPVFKKCLKEDNPTAIKLFSQNIEHLYPEEKDILDTGQEVTTNYCTDNSTTQTGKDPALCDTDNTQQTGGGICPDPTLDATCDLAPIPRAVETSCLSPPCAMGESTLMEEERSPLDSCTLVEGLLFPVEYYVRTTRRMTSCQRKVDLEAVINSQLGGTARKWTRGKTRRASTSSTPSLGAGGTPTRAPRSRRGRKSCPASVSSGANNISKQLEFSPDSGSKGDGTEGVNETSLKKEMSHEACAGNPKMEGGVKKAEAATEAREASITQDGDGYGLDGVTPHTEGNQRRVYNLRTSAKTRETGSPFHLFGDKLSLLHPLRHLDITDFHLPDEDFGLLKLEKLKSANLLESFVSQPTQQKKYFTRADSIDGSPTPSCDNAALPCGPAGVYTAESPKLATLNKANSDSFLDSNKTALCDNVPASQHGGTASPTFVSGEAPEVVRYSLSKEDDETFTPGFPVIRSFEQVLCDAPQHSAVWEPTGSNAELSVPVSVLKAPFGSLDPEATTSVRGVDVSSTNPAVDMGSCSETKPPPNVRSPAKEVPCNVVLSTSMCSVPADTHTECVFSGCTPGLPMLGLTPAAFLSPALCEEPTSPRTIRFPPQENVPLNIEDEMAAQDGADAHQFSNLSFPPLKCDNYGKETSHQGHGESANRWDQCDEEGMMGGDRLRLISEIKDACGGGRPVDLCSLWWDFSGCTDLCIVSASDYSVRLWRPQEVCKWKCVHTWNFAEIPILQILPLSQEKNLVCVALGDVEIMEIWVLASNPELLTWEKQLVKQGHTNIAQGLSRHRVVTTSGEGGNQVVELWRLSENGSLTSSQTLVAPKDSVVGFSEVDGEKDALVGSTADNNLVLWNSASGHLLGTFYIGNLCSEPVCMSATSDSGLLFSVVGSSLNKPHEINGSCVFRLIATNPHGGASALIMAYTLPDGVSSRFLEGDVKNQRAAAVLTCGSIALWDLSRSHCSAVLPPDRDRPWCLVRWGNRSSWLLAGRRDGSICVYEQTD